MLDLQAWILVLLVYGLIITFDDMETRGAMKQVNYRETERNAFLKVYHLTMGTRLVSYAILSFLTMLTINSFPIRLIGFAVDYMIAYQLSSYLSNKYRKHLWKTLVKKKVSDIDKPEQ